MVTCPCFPGVPLKSTLHTFKATLDIGERQMNGIKFLTNDKTQSKLNMAKMMKYDLGWTTVMKTGEKSYHQHFLFFSTVSS